MKIVWSERSLKDLDIIFEFYVFSASINVAQKITGKLIEKVKILTSYPEIGVVENLDFDVPFEYRYIIEGNYKIIYRIVEQKAILIARVFDTRLDPKKEDCLIFSLKVSAPLRLTHHFKCSNTNVISAGNPCTQKIFLLAVRAPKTPATKTQPRKNIAT